MSYAERVAAKSRVVGIQEEIDVSATILISHS